MLKGEYNNMFKHIVSLGFFCSVASEMEKIGLRGASYPFDWVISDFKYVIECIENNFDDFLNYNNLVQYENERDFYYDKKYKVHFYHDFSKYIDLNIQLDNVKNVYNRRIERFRNDIKESTLFLRYIKSTSELEYIENNYEYIIKLLKKFNPENELILIANNDIKSSFLNIYKVEKDMNDSVAREFLSKNSELRKYLLSDIYNCEYRENNIKIYLNSEKKKKNMKYPKKIKNVYNKLFKKVYIHREVSNF